MMEPDSVFRRLAGNSLSVLLSLIVLPLAALGQARYATPTFTTIAGLAGNAGGADGTNSVARFQYPVGVAFDRAGNLYVGGNDNNTVRKGFPASSVPAPILQPPSLSGGQFGFGITGLPGLAVNIESSTNLFSWRVSGMSVLEGGTNFYSLSPNPAQSAAFYRAQVR